MVSQLILRTIYKTKLSTMSLITDVIMENEGQKKPYMQLNIKFTKKSKGK